MIDKMVVQKEKYSFAKNIFYIFPLKEIGRILLIGGIFFIALAYTLHLGLKEYYVQKAQDTSSILKAVLQKEFNQVFVDMIKQDQKIKELFSIDPLSTKIPEDIISFKPPVISKENGALVIPLEIKIVNTNSEKIYKIVRDLDLINLSQKIRDLHLDPSLHFLLLDETLIPILQSDQTTLDRRSFYYKELFQDKIDFSSLKARTSITCPKNRAHYLYYEKIPHTPYILVLGIDRDSLFDIYKEIILYLVLLILLFLLLSFCLIYKFRRSILEKRIQEDKLQKAFFQGVTKQLQKEFQKVFSYQQIFLDLTGGKIKLTPSQKLQAIKNMIYHTHNIQETLSEEMIFSETNIIDLTKNILLMFETKSLEKKVKMSLIYKDPPLLLRCDPLKIQQVILSLLNFSLNQRQNKGTIKIFISYISEQILLEIRDDGFFFSAEERENLEATSLKNFLLLGQVRFKTIQKIIDLHQGKIFISSQQPIGNVIKIFLPITQKEIKNKTNIHQLFE